MAAVGLFTLDTSKLNEGIIGGLGTGYVDGVSTVTGSVSGVVGFNGTVSGSNTTTGLVTGSVNFVGNVSGNNLSSGLVSGFPLLFGVVSNTTELTGQGVGSPNLIGNIVGNSTVVNVVNGSPTLFGHVDGVSFSAGSAQGSPDIPPEPPTPPTPQPVPDAIGGSAYSPYKLVHWQPPKKPTPLAIAIKVVGSAQGFSITNGIVIGSLARSGNVFSSVISAGEVAGVKYPTDELVARWKRQKQENELLTIGLL